MTVFGNKTWFLGGAACDVTTPVDFFFDNLRESILVKCADDGVIRTFCNVCLHRGNQLRHSGCGNSPFLSCGFYGWQYNLGGSIKEIPEAHDFPQGIRAEKRSLRELRSEMWGGFVRISMDPDIEPPLTKCTQKMSGLLTESPRLRIRTNARAFALCERARRKGDASDVQSC
jgi:phenylpropionate dioxygenase-like ring-hydroxylating dioxygenase large terminal subunit